MPLNKNSPRGLAFIVVAVVTVSVVSAQDWPQWRGPNRDAHAQGFQAPATWPKELSQKWKTTVGAGDATPALVGSKLYVFARNEGREIAYCLDAATGKEVWKEGYDSGDATGPAARHSGPRSSPAVADGKLMTYGVRGALTCFDAGTGKVLWRKDDFASNPPRFFTSSSPLLVDDVCVAQLGNEDKGGIIAYDLGAGSEKWRWTEDGGSYASPALVVVGETKLIIALTAKRIVGLGAPDGKLLWEASFAPPQGSRAYNAATPIVDGQTIIVAGSARGAKALKLEKRGDKITSTELWSNPDNAVQFNTPVLKNGLVFGISQRGDIFCLNAQDGKTAWTAPSGGRDFGSVVDAGSVLMALTPQAELIVFGPSAKEFQKLASYKVASTEVYAYPVLSGNRIFTKDKDSVALWTLE
jgi:outer membrane protein assembly factor BamB